MRLHVLSNYADFVSTVRAFGTEGPAYYYPRTNPDYYGLAVVTRNGAVVTHEMYQPSVAYTVFEADFPQAVLLSTDALSVS